MSLGRDGDGVRIPVTRRSRARGWHGGAYPAQAPRGGIVPPMGPCACRGVGLRLRLGSLMRADASFYLQRQTIDHFKQP